MGAPHHPKPAGAEALAQVVAAEQPLAATLGALAGGADAILNEGLGGLHRLPRSPPQRPFPAAGLCDLALTENLQRTWRGPVE